MEYKKYSYSRITTFARCPRKHHYMYKEGLRSDKKSISLFLGDLWHRILQTYNEKGDIEPLFKEYDKAFMSGDTGQYPLDLIESLYMHYFKHYKAAQAEEEILGIEIEIEEELEDGDIFVGKVDKVFRLPSGHNVLRDTKTTGNSLKYTHEDVLYNQQLLVYVPYVEAKLKIKIDAIEIDEVRLAKIEPVPFNANGKPTADKRRLTLVLYDAYFDALKSLGLHLNAEYASALEYLSFRGHPLFKRTRVQLLDPYMVENNLDDIAGYYRSIKTAEPSRIRGPLCNYCEFKQLCNLDMTNPDESSRKLLTDQFVNMLEEMEKAEETED